MNLRKKNDPTSQTNNKKKASCGCRKSCKSKEQNPAHVMQELSQEANSDVLGSYTGNPQDPDDLMPVQDADDL